SDEIGAPSSVDHPATFTKMFRHPVGWWTAAPQASGWIHVVDVEKRTVWIPIVDITGSATYGGTACSALASTQVEATIPHAAGTLTVATPDGTATLESLLGHEDAAAGGWQVHFAFSAQLTE